MGIGSSRAHPDSTATVRATWFSPAERLHLRTQFDRLASQLVKDGTINREEFCRGLGYDSQDPFACRLFRVFDENDNGQLTFSEYMRGMTVLSPHGSREDKLKFAWKLFDLDGDGLVDESELAMFVQMILVNHLRLTESEIEELVQNTMEEFDINLNGYISYSEFQLMVQRYPVVLECLDVAGVLTDMPPGHSPPDDSRA